jgi:metal-dependent amidase/aminoacylase/carboxypeptidase family protein
MVDEVGLQVSVFGTPAEELYGLPEPPAGFLAPGKVVFLEAGAFEGVHAALMVHPWPTPYGALIPSLDGWRVRARFSSAGTGERLLGPAEMRGLEERLQQSIISLHQIPFLCVVKPGVADIGWYGTASLAQGMRARDAVRRCIEEAAARAGVAVEVDEYAPGAAMRHDPRLSASYRKNAEALGRVREREKDIQAEVRMIKKVFLKQMLKEGLRHPKKIFELTKGSTAGLFLDPPPEVIYGTDQGNVSWVIPAIHPYIGIGGFGANHTAEFAAQADTDEAYRAMLDGGVALAWTALDAATDPALNAYLLEAAASRVGSSPTTA